MKMTKFVFSGVLLIIAVMASGCSNPRFKKPEIVAASIETTTVEVCTIGSFLRTIPDVPEKPEPEPGNTYPSNKQMDKYYKFDISERWTCDMVCMASDILFACGEGQQQLLNVPQQCLDGNGNLDCGD